MGDVEITDVGRRPFFTRLIHAMVIGFGVFIVAVPFVTGISGKPTWYPWVFTAGWILGAMYGLDRRSNGWPIIRHR